MELYFGLVIIVEILQKFDMVELMLYQYIVCVMSHVILSVMASGIVKDYIGKEFHWIGEIFYKCLHLYFGY